MYPAQATMLTWPSPSPISVGRATPPSPAVVVVVLPQAVSTNKSTANNANNFVRISMSPLIWMPVDRLG